MRRVEPDEDVEIVKKRGSIDFKDKEVLIPYEPALATKVLIQVYRNRKWFPDSFIGRAELSFAAQESFQMSPYNIDDGNTTVYAQLKYVDDDTSAEEFFGGQRAQCGWLKSCTGKDLRELCEPQDKWHLFNSMVGRPDRGSCAEFIQQVGGEKPIETSESSQEPEVSEMKIGGYGAGDVNETFSRLSDKYSKQHDNSFRALPSNPTFFVVSVLLAHTF